VAQRRRKKTKNVFLNRIIIFSTVFIICLVIFSVIAALIYMPGYFDNKKTQSKPSQTIVTVVKPANLLLVVTDGADFGKAYYTLLRTDVNKPAFPVTALPRDFILTAGSKTDTLSGMMAYGGIKMAKQALEETLMPLSNYEDITNKLGGINYNVVGNLHYTDKDGTVITALESGRQNLPGSYVTQLLRYPLWQEGEVKRLEIQASIFENQIDQALVTTASQDKEPIFKYIINLMTTNISGSDFFIAKDYIIPLSAKSPAYSLRLPVEDEIKDGKVVYRPGDITEFRKAYQ